MRRAGGSTKAAPQERNLKARHGGAEKSLVSGCGFSRIATNPALKRRADKAQRPPVAAPATHAPPPSGYKLARKPMPLALKSTHATVGQLYIDHEGAVRSAFQTLLGKCGQKATPRLTLVPEYRIERAHSSVIVDGALVDLYHLPHGY